MAYSSSTTWPTTPQDCVLYVFRKTDLRVTDNLALKKAVSFGLPVCGVVCLDIQEWNRRGQTTGLVSTGSLRRRFLLESVEDINESLTCLRERFGRTGRARDAIETQQVSTSPAPRVADAAENNEKNARKSGRGPLFVSALSLSATVEKLLGLNTSGFSLRYRIAHVVCTHEVGSFEEEEQQETTRVVARGVSASTGSQSSSGTHAQFHVVHDDTLVPRDILSNEVGLSLDEAGLKSSDRTFFKQYTQFRGAIEKNAHRAVSHENKADRHTRFVPALEFREAYCTKMGSFVSTSEHSARGIFSADIAPKFWPWSSTPAGSKSSHAPSSDVVDPEFVTLAEVVCDGKATDDDLVKILGPDIWAWNSDKTPDLLLKFSVDSAGNQGFHVAESTTVHTAETPTYRGGERAALKRLKYYLWDSNAVATYKETRNESVGDKYSTKFSMYLAAGNISPRTIVHELTLYEKERSQNESTYWVVFELLWRDFLHFASAVYPRNKFYRLKGIFPRRNWTTSGKKPDWALDMSDNTQKVRLFECWKSGTTGFPYIDAQMRELRATGFMGNRGRQNVASFLIFNLKCDWRWGAEWFEHCLLDHDPASNYGNWQTIAGVGFQDRENRFNVVKQSRQYESKGSAMKKWIPELQPTADLLHKQVSSSRGEASSTNDPRLMEVWHCPWNVHDKSLLPAVYANPILDPRKEFFDPGHRAEAGAGKDGGKGRALNQRVDGKEQDARNNKQNNVGKRHGGESDGKRWGRKN